MSLVSTGTQPRPRVLLAAGNAELREQLRRMLCKSYEVDVVADGHTAFDHLASNAPDLILADVMLPDIDSVQLVAAIRADDRVRSLPVILVSTRGGEEARIQGLRAGADESIVKPFSGRELLARVASQLALARFRNETERQLREADARKDQFLAQLAHELRNLLAPIRTGLELVRLNGDSKESVERNRLLMERQVGHMVRLIDDLLDISRITTGKVTLQRVPTLLRGLVQGAIDAQRIAIEANQIDLRLDLPQTPCVINVDPTRFVQVISNIVHNALKFTPSHGSIRVAAEITPRGRGEDDELSIAVSDNGMGMSKETLPHVFDLFAQAEHARGEGYGGMGIGLALARRLVELQGGTIEAHSDGPGHGSTFVIRLPVSREHAVPVPTRNTVPHFNCRVVIIDDNRDAADALAMAIEQLGGEARTADNGFAGLHAIEEFRPDVVLLDLTMPGIDGYETCRRIRRELDGNMVIVALTGWGQEHDKQRSFEAGFDAHLTKPVDLASFEELLAGTASAH